MATRKVFRVMEETKSGRRTGKDGRGIAYKSHPQDNPECNIRCTPPARSVKGQKRTATVRYRHRNLDVITYGSETGKISVRKAVKKAVKPAAKPVAKKAVKTVKAVSVPVTASAKKAKAPAKKAKPSSKKPKAAPVNYSGMFPSVVDRAYAQYKTKAVPARKPKAEHIDYSGAFFNVGDAAERAQVKTVRKTSVPVDYSGFNYSVTDSAYMQYTKANASAEKKTAKKNVTVKAPAVKANPVPVPAPAKNAVKKKAPAAPAVCACAAEPAAVKSAIISKAAKEGMNPKELEKHIIVAGIPKQAPAGPKVSAFGKFIDGYCVGKPVKYPSAVKSIYPGDSVRKWYMENFPTDELAREINPKLTFADFIRMTTHEKLDPYVVLGVGDSIVRERVQMGIRFAYKAGVPASPAQAVRATPTKAKKK